MALEMKLLIGVALLCGIALAAERARFDNYRVYRVNIYTDDQLIVLKELESKSDSYQFWKEPEINEIIDIVVPPHKFAEINEIFDQYKFKYSLKIKNLQNIINEEVSVRSKQAEFGWDAYYTIDEIYNWIDEQVDAYPQIVTNLTVGTTFQGRPIRAVRLSHQAKNPTIIIEATIHAREWIASATATYLLNALLTSNDTGVQDLARSFNWVIIPVLNVDGYVYSHRHNRLWRKTRRPVSRLCYGADANRNFDVHFAEQGTSPNPCSETYPGNHPFSEYESRALSEFARGIDHQLYISFHAYGQLLMYPFGHTTEPSWNDEHLDQIAKKSIEAITARYNTTYTYGSISNAIYKASGGSIDWIYDSLNTSLSYVFEFRDRGTHGFLLPADQIIPNSLEFLDGLKALIGEARLLNYF